MDIGSNRNVHLRIIQFTCVLPSLPLLICLSFMASFVSISLTIKIQIKLNNEVLFAVEAVTKRGFVKGSVSIFGWKVCEPSCIFQSEPPRINPIMHPRNVFPSDLNTAVTFISPSYICLWSCVLLLFHSTEVPKYFFVNVWITVWKTLCPFRWHVMAQSWFIVIFLYFLNWSFYFSLVFIFNFQFSFYP